MTRQNAQHLAALFFAVRFDAMSQHIFISGLVHAFFETKAAALLGLLQRPTSQDAGYLGDISLGIAAVHAESMKFHEFAAIVFIQAAALALGLFHLRRTPLSGRPAPVVIVIPLRDAVGEIGIGPHAQPVVEIKEHGG